MAEDETQQKIFMLLDVLASQGSAIATRMDALAQQTDALAQRTSAIASDLAEHRRETSAGFERVERRLGHLETRLEDLENPRSRFSSRLGTARFRPRIAVTFTRV